MHEAPGWHTRPGVQDPLSPREAVATGLRTSSDGDRATHASSLRPPDRRLVLGLVAVEVLALAHLTWDGFFVYDDYTLLRQAQRFGLSWRLLVAPLNIHLSPARSLFDWVLVRAGGLEYGLAQVFVLAWFAASVLVLHRLLVELFGDGWWPLLLALLYGTSIVHVGTAQWWAAAALSLPCAVLTMLSVLAFVRYHRGGGRRLLVLSALAFAGALLFYLKALLLPLYLVLLRVLVLDPDRSVRKSLAATAREWRTWCVYAVPFAVYVGAYLAWYPWVAGFPTLSDAAEFLRLSWLRSFVPNVVGFQLSKHGGSAGDRAAVVAAQLVLVGVAAWSMSRHRRAWRAWLFFALAFLANAAVVGVERLGLGPEIAYSHRYWVEPTYLLALATGGAFVGFGGSRARAHGGPRAAGRPKAWTAVAVGALAGHLGLAWIGADRAVAVWPGRDARRYFEHVDAQLAALRHDGVHPTVLDGAIPDEIMPAWVAYGEDVPYHRYSQAFRLLDDGLRFDRPSRDLFSVTPDGSLVAATFVPEWGGDGAALRRGGRLSVHAGSVDDGAGALCLRSGPWPASVELQPARPLTGGDLYAELVWTADRAGPLAVFPDDGSGYHLLQQAPVTVPGPGRGDALVRLSGARLLKVRVDLPPRSRLCLDRLELGAVTTAGGRAGTDAGGAPLLDPFDRDDVVNSLGSTAGGTSWQAGAGTWGVDGGLAAATAPVPGPNLAVLDAPLADGEASVRVARVTARAGIVFRYHDPRNYWAVEAAPGFATWGVVQVVDGHESVVGDTGLASTTDGTTVGVRMHGDSVEVVVDGRTAVVVATGPGSPGTDRVGLTVQGPDAAGARFADFAVAHP